MTPARTGKGKRASYRLDRVLEGVGRLQVKVGSTRLADYRAADALVTKLFDQGRLDLLRALMAKTLTMRELRDADRREELAHAQAAVYARRPFLPIARQLLRQARWRSVETKGYYEDGLRALEAVLDETTTVAELLELDWPRIADCWPNSAADWMRVRRTLSRIASLLFGDKYHPLRRQLMTVLPRKKEVPREPTLTPDGFWQAVALLPEPIRPIICALVGTGLRRKELWRLTRTALRPAVHGIVIGGQLKTEASHRFLELDPAIYAYVAACVPIKLRADFVLKRWQRALREAHQPATTLHDLRHCFGQWTLDSGVSDADVQAAMGHATAHQTRVYRMRQQRRMVSTAVAKALGLNDVPQSVPQAKSKTAKRKERKRA